MVVFDALFRSTKIVRFDHHRHRQPNVSALALNMNDGDPGMTRTCDLRFRKPSLYPAELRDRIDFIRDFFTLYVFGSFLALQQF